MRDTCVIQAVRIGDKAWISTPCDFSGELALGVKDHLRARGADAVLAASIFHFGEFTIGDAKSAMERAGLTVRPAHV